MTALAATCVMCSCVSEKQDAARYPLAFNPNSYEERTLVSGDVTLAYRAYENIVYVQNPVETEYQMMNIYVPSAYFSGDTLCGYTAQSAPIFFPNEVGGYMPGTPGTVDGRMAGDTQQTLSTIARALLNGYVVVSPGARGRTTATGRAPACIVDLKAAVRYVRYNDKVLPGNAEKIISNGTSAGGALSALLAASGNSSDDDIYAASAYCPITNLEHADAAYEWQFNDVHTYKKIDSSMLDYKVQRTYVTGTLTEDEERVSADLKTLFPLYVNSLNIRANDGTSLTLDAAGNGTFKDSIKSAVIASAQHALDRGTDMSSYDFLTINKNTVTGIDFDAYISYLGRQKLPPAFDALDASSGENNVFGNETAASRHFTEYGAVHSTKPGSETAEPHIVKMMNAMNYIGEQHATTAKYWRIRHGTKDSDTSLAIPFMLATLLQNNGYAVDFAFPWDKTHSGDYDIDELFAWIDSICR